MKEIIQKVESGAPLTDLELIHAIDFYKRVEADLNILGPKFFITKSYVFQTINTLEMFKNNRGI